MESSIGVFVVAILSSAQLNLFNEKNSIIIKTKKFENEKKKLFTKIELLKLCETHFAPDFGSQRRFLLTSSYLVSLIIEKNFEEKFEVLILKWFQMTIAAVFRSEGGFFVDLIPNGGPHHRKNL